MSAPAVTFLSHTARPGGAELALRRYLLAAQVPVRLVTMEQGEVWEGLPCPVTVASSVPAVARALRRGDGPVVANSMRAALVGALVTPRRRPLAYWVRDGLTDSAMSPLALALTRHVTARRVSVYLANSRWTAATVREALGVAAERVSVVQSMCGVSRERRPAQRLGYPTPVRLLYLGRIAEWKAPHLAVQALGSLRERGVGATLTVAGAAQFGEDRYERELDAFIGDQPGASRAGHVEDVPALLASHDILVHCSTVPEPFGQVIVQAFAAGVPVVATDHGGPRELLRRGGGRLVTPDSYGEIADAVVEILADYPRTSRAALASAADLDDEAASGRTDEVLLEWAATLSPRPG